MGKAFEEQTRRVKVQIEKHIKAIQNQGQVKTNKKYIYNNKDNPLISKIFNKLADERLKKITGLDKKVNPDNLIYRYKGHTAGEKFDEFDNALNPLDKIKKVK